MHLIWEEFLKIIKEECGGQVVETWFKAVKLERWDKETNTVFFKMPNQFVSKWIKDKYSTLIKTHLSRLLYTTDIKLFFSLDNAKIESAKDRTIIPASPLQKQILVDTIYPQKEATGSQIIQRPATTLQETKKNLPVAKFGLKKRSICKLNEEYTFDSYVVGPNNSLAHAAAMAVAQNLGKSYNPLFVYGGTGLGKTHLMHAIGNEAKRINPNTKVYYETSDNFIHEFINSIRLDKARQFREKYHKINLLLLDDIQFFSKKEQTQETFFHIFDQLQQQNKQVVFSSDTLPQDISGLQSRLKSRLQSGLIADIHMPTLETKMAILKKKAIIHAIELDDDVTKFIASMPATSIRELEGYLVRVSAVSSLSNRAISLELAKQILRQFETKEDQNLSIEKIAKEVAKQQGTTLEELKSKKRSKNLAFTRQFAFYMMKKLTVSSLQSMGKYMGGRDHSTVLHAITKIGNLQEQDAHLALKIKNFEKSMME